MSNFLVNRWKNTPENILSGLLNTNPVVGGLNDVRSIFDMARSPTQRLLQMMSPGSGYEGAQQSHGNNQFPQSGYQPSPPRIPPTQPSTPVHTGIQGTVDQLKSTVGDGSDRLTEWDTYWYSRIDPATYVSVNKYEGNPEAMSQAGADILLQTIGQGADPAIAQAFKENANEYLMMRAAQINARGEEFTSIDYWTALGALWQALNERAAGVIPQTQSKLTKEDIEKMRETGIDPRVAGMGSQMNQAALKKELP